MRTVSIREAKTHLSRLVEAAAKGEPFIIGRAAKPLVRVVPLETPEPKRAKQLGFMAGQIAVPDDFDTIGCDEIEGLFAGRPA
jgi:prevent-host-death family protein